MKNTILFISVSLATIWLRLINLGYSNYQGDEIKALYRPEAGQGLFDFLLSQKKGPLQFLVTYILKFFNPSYNNEFLIRLPFSIAAILAVYFFYKFVKLQFGKKLALYSSFFLATNGLFVAFSRIVQYQSLVILFSICTLYCLSLSLKYKTWTIYGLYLGMVFWGLSILAHYDGIFIAPFVFYLLFKWYTDNNSSLQKNEKLKHFSLSLTVLFLIISVFYLPFFGAISESKIAYWSERISGEQNTSSMARFKTYNPTLVIYIYAILGFLSLGKIRKNFLVLLWFLFPFIFMEFLISQPRTHIYTYIIPLCILISYGLEILESWSKNIFPIKSNAINNFALSVMFIFLFFLSNSVFVDHSKEYPWENKNFLIWELPETYIEGLFGFPYYRHWEEIGSYLKTANSNGYYLANDTEVITRHYLPANYLPFEADADNLEGYIYIIDIKNSQRPNLEILQKKSSYWQSRYKPIKTFFNNGIAVAKIYRLPTSDLENLRDSSN